jgi:hypothetical protein
MNSFTMKLHGKGWLVKDFLEYWDVCRKTYERMTNDVNRHDKLNKMIDAMGEK